MSKASEICIFFQKFSCFSFYIQTKQNTKYGLCTILFVFTYIYFMKSLNTHWERKEREYRGRKMESGRSEKDPFPLNRQLIMMRRMMMMGRTREGWRGRENDKKENQQGLETVQSFQSFLMLRFHSQDRWSCLSSSVNFDLMV